jgi:cysteine protease ATG4
VTIFGNTFDSNQEAKIVYSSILWFTYREGLHFKGASITSDVGWGCMLRVGQMAMAEALRRTEGIDKYGDRETVGRIINLFIDKDELFCVERMVEVGERMFRKGAGEWFTPSETAHILK